MRTYLRDLSYAHVIERENIFSIFLYLYFTEKGSQLQDEQGKKKNLNVGLKSS